MKWRWPQIRVGASRPGQGRWGRVRQVWDGGQQAANDVSVPIPLIGGLRPPLRRRRWLLWGSGGQRATAPLLLLGICSPGPRALAVARRAHQRRPRRRRRRRYGCWGFGLDEAAVGVHVRADHRGPARAAPQHQWRHDWQLKRAHSPYGQGVLLGVGTGQGRQGPVPSTCTGTRTRGGRRQGPTSAPAAVLAAATSITLRCAWAINGKEGGGTSPRVPHLAKWMLQFGQGVQKGVGCMVRACRECVGGWKAWALFLGRRTQDDEKEKAGRTQPTSRGVSRLRRLRLLMGVRRASGWLGVGEEQDSRALAGGHSGVALRVGRRVWECGVGLRQKLGGV